MSQVIQLLRATQDHVRRYVLLAKNIHVVENLDWTIRSLSWIVIPSDCRRPYRRVCRPTDEVVKTKSNTQ
ncbi:uncharacterized protein PHALS_09679 [Plasmopara halstedii]|uniref:Uncharacterized protein n=1 Tax=Plasmopara halstedii TaxID=4781 RepID=A0A0P1AFR2_PLAHL|nr:uncharacterized protein PHALS_09679 [Plasmopara halstedii]CEG39432.1 hypothetical protein PHALS_09679 [Plasmopara halstedii]|eukprot:XP_024575801.1 hypothetical protein PHALS_09679 [Plasmopara halstedii]